MLTAATDLLTDPDDVPVRRLRIDEHRYRSVRFFRDENDGWRRYKWRMQTGVGQQVDDVAVLPRPVPGLLCFRPRRINFEHPSRPEPCVDRNTPLGY